MTVVFRDILRSLQPMERIYAHEEFLISGLIRRVTKSLRSFNIFLTQRAVISTVASATRCNYNILAFNYFLEKF